MFNIKALTGKKLESRKAAGGKQKKLKKAQDATQHVDASFSKTLNSAREQVHIEDLHQFIGEIQEQGDILKQYPNKKEFLKYKALISTFLRRVVQDSLRVNKKQIHRKNQEQVTAEIIDEKLYKLGQYILLEEEETLEVAAAIDEIRGLIFDSFERVQNP